MHIVDLSHKLGNNMPYYPADNAPFFNKVYTYEKNGVNLTEFKMSCHMGTHLDCPSHLTGAQLFTDNMALTSFLGSGLVVNCRDFILNNEITLDVLDNITTNNVDYLLFYTGYDKYWGKDEYFADFPVFSKELAERLASMPIKGIGVDVISVDPVNSTDFYNHKQLLSNGIIIVENMTNMSKLLNDNFDFYALPLKIENGDGSPVRAIAVVK